MGENQGRLQRIVDTANRVSRWTDDDVLKWCAIACIATAIVFVWFVDTAWEFAGLVALLLCAIAMLTPIGIRVARRPAEE